MTLCFCQHCPCNCGTDEGESICPSCRQGYHCSNGNHGSPFDDYPTGTFREPGSLADLADWVERNGDPLPPGSANAIAATIRARLDDIDEWIANQPRIVP